MRFSRRRLAPMLAILVVCVSLSIPAQGDERTIHPGYRPLPKAVKAKNGMVVTAHPLASRAGLQMLQAGGSAIDALVAVQLVLTVAEPGSSGIGGGSFILYHDSKSGKTHAIDGREEVPAAARREDYMDARGQVKKDARTGGQAVGVPGTVASMWLAHGKWGRLPMSDVARPAIELAERGSGITNQFRRHIAMNQSRFLRFPSSKAAFLTPEGGVPEIGQPWPQSDLAKTLRLLAEQGPKPFYDGEIARDIVRSVQQSGYQPGKMTLEDLRAYRAVYREPIRFTYRGHEIVGMPPPSSGGITMGLILGMLEGTDWNSVPPGSLPEINLIARAGATAFADRNAYLGDADWNPSIPMRQILLSEYVRARAKAMRQMKPGTPALPGALGKPAPGIVGENPNEGTDTSHISIVDAERNVVSCTTTIEHQMGSGLVVSGRGFVLNNELTDFDLDQLSGPNIFDPSRKPRTSALTDNKEPAGKRPRSSMTPTIVFKNGKPILTVGSPGGPHIIGVVAQVTHNVLDYGMDIQSALNAPRVNSQNRPVELEWCYPNRGELVDHLKARGWEVKEFGPNAERTFGNAHGIRLLEDGSLEGGADPRGEGAARGY